MCTSTGLEARLGEGVGHLHVRVDALLAQDGDAGPWTAGGRGAPTPALPAGGRESNAFVLPPPPGEGWGEGPRNAIPDPPDPRPPHARCPRTPGCRAAGRSSSSRCPRPGAGRQLRAEHGPGVAPDLHLALAHVDGGIGRTRLAHEVAVLDRPCARSTCITSLRSAVRTCSTTPSSSLNSALSVSSSRRAPTWLAQFLASPYSARLSLMPSPSVTSRSTLSATPTWPAKAISQAAANRPPSLRSW